MDLITGEREQDSKAPSDGALDEGTISRMFQRDLKASRTHFTDWRDESRQLYDMAAGRQWSAEDEETLREQKRPMVTFNVAGKYLDAMQGLQINNRQDIKFAPRQEGAARANELLTGAVAWGRDLTCMADDETDAFYDAVLTGVGCMEGYLDKDLEPHGVPGGERVDPLEVFPDPNSRKRNFEDARFDIRVKWYVDEEYREIVGDLADEQTPPDLVGLDSEDEDQLTVITQPQDYDADTDASIQVSRTKRPIADYQFWRREDFFQVTAEGYGDQTFDKKSWAAIEPLLRKKGVKYRAVKSREKVYYRAMLAGTKVIKWGRNSYQKGFTRHYITGKRDRNKRTWYGIGRSILDPQRWVNKFFSTILYVMTTNAKGGIMAEEGAFVDQKKAEQTWANPSAITMLKSGAISGNKIQDKPQGAYPLGLDKLMEFSLNALPQTSGMNLELMGLADRVQAGVVEAQRKQSAMAIVAWAFDAMRRYYRSMGRMLGNYVIDYVPDGTLVLINGQQGKQYVPLVKSQMSATFDMIVDEAPTSVNQQERVWSVLQTIIPQLLQAGIKVPKEVITYAPLPEDLKNAWTQTLQPDPKEQQKAEQSAQLTLRQMAADATEKEASAKLDAAKALQIEAELKAGPDNPAAIAQIQADAKKQIAQMQEMVDARIAEIKINRDAETKILIEQMSIKSEERLATLQAMIDARLEAARMATDASTQLAVATISKPTPAENENAGKIEELHQTVADLHEKLKKAAKPRKFEIIRDKNGDMQKVVQLAE